MRFARLLSIASALFLVSASPLVERAKKTRCDVSAASFAIPAGSALSVPPTQTPKFILLGVGVQNYTCGATGTYTTAGAVAELYDISCLYGKPLFTNIQDAVYEIVKRIPNQKIADIVSSVASQTAYFLGDHYFIRNAAGGISPKFDLSNVLKDPSQFIIAARAAGAPSPAGAANVDWLQLSNVSGSLAQTVFRVDTRAGQPPASCTAGSSPPISVKYTTKYWAYA